MNEIRQTGPEDGPQAQLPIPSALVARAQALGVDAAQAAAEGIRRAVLRAQASQTSDENRAAAEAWNRYVNEHGMPFEDIMERPI